MLPPERIWICPVCNSRFIEGWRLKRHLMLTHLQTTKRAWQITDQNEYWLRFRQAEYINPLEHGLIDDNYPGRPTDRRRKK